MVSKKVELRVSEFCSSIKGLNSSEIIKRCKAEYESLKEEYNDTYLRSVFTAYRNELKTIEPRVLKVFRLKAREQNKIEKAYSRTLSKQHKSLKKINNFELLVSKSIELLDSSNIIEVVLALCVLTGRRSTEILKTAKFTNHKKSNKMLQFKGQLKKRVDFDKYPFYTLGNSAKLCKVALLRVRASEKLKNVSNDNVARMYEPKLRAKCTRLFGDHLGSCSAHDLRKAYACICVELFKPSNQTINSFLSEILGHSVDDITTANSYQKYYI